MITLTCQEARTLYEEILDGWSKEDLIKVYLDKLGKLQVVREMSLASENAKDLKKSSR